MRKHIDDLRTDIYLKHVDILALCETRVFESDLDLNIEGLSLFCADQQQSKHGMALYYKPNIVKNQLIATSISGIELLITILDVANICFIYCPPKSATNQNFANVIQYIQSIINITKPTIIMGDFNQNALQNCSVLNFLQHNYSFHQILKSPTTDYDSCLDQIYINFPQDRLCLSGTLESYYSEHKPIIYQLYQKHLKT